MRLRSGRSRSGNLIHTPSASTTTVLECAVNPNAMLFDVPHACTAGYAHAQVDVLSRIEEAASSGTEDELARALKWFLALDLGCHRPPHANKGREPRQRGRHCLAAPEALARRGHGSPDPEVAEGYIASMGQEAPTRRALTYRPLRVVEGDSSAPTHR